MTLHSVSIVTSTWNERKNIRKLIPNIREILRHIKHEIIVVDDDSRDGTFQVAKELADLAVKKPREGQSKGLLRGMRSAKYPIVVTIDADLENDPQHIPELIAKTKDFDIIVASRTRLPRISEKLAQKTLGKTIGVKDAFSNFRAYKREVISSFRLKGGETFGAEFLVIAKKKGFRISEIVYDPPARRNDPRIGGSIRANLRIIWALIKSLTIYFIC
jgi:dolichol-phosphate mannosyltransferase